MKLAFYCIQNAKAAREVEGIVCSISLHYTYVDSSLNCWQHFWTFNCILIPTITRCDSMHSRWSTDKRFSFFCFLDVATSMCYAIWLKTCIQLCGWDTRIWASYKSVVCIITGGAAQKVSSGYFPSPEIFDLEPVSLFEIIFYRGKLGGRYG